MPISTAILSTAGMAKIIEITMTAGFVTFLGQTLVERLLLYPEVNEPILQS